MRRTTSLGIVLLSVVLAQGALINVGEGKERTTLSSLVGRLFKKSQPVDEEVAPSADQTTTPQPDPGNLPPERTQRVGSNWQVTRLPEAKSHSLPYAPLPPAVEQAWVRPPLPQPHRAFTTEEVVALTRHAGTQESSRRGFYTPASDNSKLEEINFDRAGSPSLAAVRFPVKQVRQVAHVTELAAPSGKNLPNGPLPIAIMPGASPQAESPRAERSPVATEDLPVGNMPAEVREQALSPRPIAPVLAPAFQKVRGRIAAIDPTTGIIRVDLSEEESLPTGTKIRVYHEIEAGQFAAVHMRVVDSMAGVAAAKLIDEATLDSIAPGDKTVAWKTDTGQ